jgi:hypothetical protein
MKHPTSVTLIAAALATVTASCEVSSGEGPDEADAIASANSDYMDTYDECWAGNELPAERVSDSECDTECTWMSGVMCGGGWRNSVRRVP